MRQPLRNTSDASEKDDSEPGGDFSSATLMQLVGRALAARGIEIAQTTALSRSGRMPLTQKRSFLDEVADRHGLSPILEAGAAISAMPSEALRVALVRAPSPADLLNRWSRLERFAHSRHRLICLERHDEGCLLAHQGLSGKAPTRPESALILGLLAALFHLIGVTDLQVSLGADAKGEIILEKRRFREPSAQATLSAWRFRWRNAPSPNRPQSQVGETDPTAIVRDMVARDPTRAWTLDEIAAELQLTRRTLQRRLATVGGFSNLAGEVRAAEAAKLLVASRWSLAEIGFACGYADQPHFTREFLRRTAMTPKRYREEFQ